MNLTGDPNILAAILIWAGLIILVLARGFRLSKLQLFLFGSVDLSTPIETVPKPRLFWPGIYILALRVMVLSVRHVYPHARMLYLSMLFDPIVSLSETQVSACQKERKNFERGYIDSAKTDRFIKTSVIEYKK